jgi:hypothetical protein
LKDEDFKISTAPDFNHKDYVKLAMQNLMLKVGDIRVCYQGFDYPDVSKLPDVYVVQFEVWLEYRQNIRHKMRLPKKGSLMHLVTVPNAVTVHNAPNEDLEFMLPEDYLSGCQSVRVYFGGDVTSWVKKNHNRVFTIEDWASDE